MISNHQLYNAIREICLDYNCDMEDVFSFGNVPLRARTIRNAIMYVLTNEHSLNEISIAFGCHDKKRIWQYINRYKKKIKNNDKYLSLTISISQFLILHRLIYSITIDN